MEWQRRDTKKCLAICANIISIASPFFLIAVSYRLIAGGVTSLLSNIPAQQRLSWTCSQWQRRRYIYESSSGGGKQSMREAQRWRRQSMRAAKQRTTGAAAAALINSGGGSGKRRTINRCVIRVLPAQCSLLVAQLGCGWRRRCWLSTRRRWHGDECPNRVLADVTLSTRSQQQTAPFCIPHRPTLHN